MRFGKLLLITAALSVETAADAATFSVTTAASSGAGSLAQAILDANETPELDKVDFNLLGAGVFTIKGPFPAIEQPLVISGYTQAGSSVNGIAEHVSNAAIRVVLDGGILAAGSPVVRISASGSALRGVAIQNIPSGGAGVAVDAGVTGVAIDGCFIGTNAAGDAATSLGNGILFDGSGTIGGVAPADRNVISGNAGTGIVIHGGDVFVYNNLIGREAFGENDLGNGVGIEISGGAGDNFIGGFLPGQANEIAASAEQGILVTGTNTVSNEIAGNDIVGSGALGIDLAGDGVTPNDETDLDGGPNSLQNFPEIAGARANDHFLRVDGTLTTQPGQYRLDLFIAGERSPSGFGEGAYVGSTNVAVPAGETSVRFATTLDLGFRPEEDLLVSATAEEAGLRNSSEFSRAVVAPQAGSELVVTNTNDVGAGSLRAALDAANGNEDSNTIVFNIPGDGPHTISPVAFLAIHTGPLVVDGYTQPGAALNTLPSGSNAIPGIVLDGSGEGGAAVLDVAHSATVRGLSIVHGKNSGVRFLNVDGARIDGCFVGIGADGETAVGNTKEGIVTTESSDVTIGGAARGQRNLIAANGTRGIFDSATSTRMFNNLVGASSGNATEGNRSDGILATGTFTVIGGDSADLENAILGNQGSGIRIDGDARVDVRGNRIEANAGLGIDLAPAGVTVNDLDDADSGANNLQNFPEPGDTAAADGILSVSGTLDVPGDHIDATYTIRVFASDECDPSGFGEGGRMLGASIVEIPADEHFEFAIRADVAPGELVTLTATDRESGATSEFSPCLTVRNPGCGDFNGNGSITAGDALAVLQVAVGTRDCALCTCDVNGSAQITSTDALFVLRVAVGQDVTLSCPACT